MKSDNIAVMLQLSSQWVSSHSGNTQCSDLCLCSIWTNPNTNKPRLYWPNILWPTPLLREKGLLLRVEVNFPMSYRKISKFRQLVRKYHYAKPLHNSMPSEILINVYPYWLYMSVSFAHVDQTSQIMVIKIIYHSTTCFLNSPHSQFIWLNKFF